MTPAAIIEQAAADGVQLSLNATGSIKATGEAEAVNRWLSVIRETKPQIIAVLQQAAEGTANHWRVHFPNRAPLEIFCSPDASKRQVLADYPDAVAAEAIPDTPNHELPLSPELESLVRKEPRITTAHLMNWNSCLKRLATIPKAPSPPTSNSQAERRKC